MLFTYLASWGMLRNSFLLQKDYRFNLPVVEILCSKTYETLYENRIPTINDISLILQLKEEIERYYESQYYFNEIKAKTKIKNVSITLTSKIILGTTGMSLAYDRYVRVGLSKNKLCSTFSKKSLLELVNIAYSNKDIIEEYIKKVGPIYTPMKILDMFFFEEGMKGQ